MQGRWNMRLSKDFLAHDTGDEVVLVPTGRAEFSGLLRGNKTLGAILELLHAETTPEEITARMCERFDVAPEVARRDVDKVVAQLREIGAIDGA